MGAGAERGRSQTRSTDPGERKRASWPERDVSERGDARPITALLFLEAADLGEAVQIAEAHPALRYGANVEVRQWAPPAAVPASTRAAR